MRSDTRPKSWQSSDFSIHRKLTVNTMTVKLYPGSKVYERTGKNPALLIIYNLQAFVCKLSSHELNTVFKVKRQSTYKSLQMFMNLIITYVVTELLEYYCQ